RHRQQAPGTNRAGEPGAGSRPAPGGASLEEGVAMMSFLMWASLLLSYAPQQAGSTPLAPDLEARVQALGKQLRCAVCQGVAIADSPAQMARAQLDRVRELVAEGKSDSEIRSYFVARYGEWVLLEPPAHGINWVVWGGPIALALGGALVIA